MCWPSPLGVSGVPMPHNSAQLFCVGRYEHAVTRTPTGVGVCVRGGTPRFGLQIHVRLSDGNAPVNTARLLLLLALSCRIPFIIYISRTPLPTDPLPPYISLSLDKLHFHVQICL